MNIQTRFEDFSIHAYNKRTQQQAQVLLICFVNQYVDVMPESELEGGSQVSWEFNDIILTLKQS